MLKTTAICLMLTSAAIADDKLRGKWSGSKEGMTVTITFKGDDAHLVIDDRGTNEADVTCNYDEKTISLSYEESKQKGWQVATVQREDGTLRVSLDPVPPRTLPGKKSLSPQPAPLQYRVVYGIELKRADHLITAAGDYKIGELTLKVSEEDGEIQWRAKVGNDSIGPTEPAIDKDAPWFVYLTRKSIWVFDGKARVVLVKLDGKKQLTARADLPGGWKALTEQPPKEVLEQLPAELQP